MADLKTVKLIIKGVVQGVGFRPFIYRIAKELKLFGRVSNTSEGVVVYVNVDEDLLKRFIELIKTKKPPTALISSITYESVDFINFKDFKIEKSAKNKKIEALIPVDLKVCDKCIEDIFNPKDRRFLYPFTNCTNCGPRFSIIKKVPYDRKNTTMKDFKMCRDCKKEYEDPLDRRFHAQPNACPLCGPFVWVITYQGEKKCNDCFDYIARRIISGGIVAIKGLGGFHLACDAFNQEAVKKLREFKRRDFKPFAIMIDDIDDISEMVYTNKTERDILYSVASPIVMLRKKDRSSFEYVSPMLDNVGVMIAYTPLHKILFYFLKKYGFKNPLVMTSGNLRDEPIIKDNDDAIRVFKGFDIFLHNREIYNRIDDSVVFVDELGNIRFIRRSRGYVPSPVILKMNFKNEVFACGGDIKNHFAVYKDGKVFLSPYIGDLENESNRDFFISSYKSMKKLLGFNPKICLVDKHPNYFSTMIAKELFPKIFSVGHHIAHICSVMAENALVDNVIGVAFDGTGWGDDGNIWGGEFFVIKDKLIKRVAHFKYFKLSGGDLAIKEVYRSFVSFFGSDKDFVYEFLKDKIDLNRVDIIFSLGEKNINTFHTSSCGRIFDAVGVLVCGDLYSNFEAEVAMKLEHIAYENRVDERYSFDLTREKDGYVIEWEGLVRDIIKDWRNKKSNVISSKFHNSIIYLIKEMVEKLSIEYQINDVCFSGGVFQNRYLLNGILKILGGRYNIFFNSKTPSNDGCISLGQIYYYLNFLARKD